MSHVQVVRQRIAENLHARALLGSRGRAGFVSAQYKAGGVIEFVVV